MSDRCIERRYWRKRNRGAKRHPCPTCKRPNALTDSELRQGYQCDACARRAEGTSPWLPPLA